MHVHIARFIKEYKLKVRIEVKGISISISSIFTNEQNLNASGH